MTWERSGGRGALTDLGSPRPPPAGREPAFASCPQMCERRMFLSNKYQHIISACLCASFCVFVFWTRPKNTSSEWRRVYKGGSDRTGGCGSVHVPRNPENLSQLRLGPFAEIGQEGSDWILHCQNSHHSGFREGIVLQEPAWWPSGLRPQPGRQAVSSYCLLVPPPPPPPPPPPFLLQSSFLSPLD